jgi:mercuric ion binding protein
MREWIGRSVLMMAVMIMLGPTSAHDVAADSQGSQTVILDIEGMTCGACVKDVKASLAQVPGVSMVEITVGKKWVFFSDYADARALVTFDPQKTGVDALVKAVEAASSPLSAYKARVLDK